jgi:hypothetical protein
VAFKSEFIFERLGDFWRRFKEADVLKAYWDGIIELVSNLALNADQANRGKALTTVPVFHRSSPVLFIFDQTTEILPPDPGYAATFKVDPEITSIPVLSSKSDGSGTLLFEGASYAVTGTGRISFSAFPSRLFFAPDVICDKRTIYKNFGYPIGFKQQTSDVYRNRTQGLWYALWSGAAVNNIKLGFHILFGLPFVQKGTVQNITVNFDGSTTVVIDGVSHYIPPYLQPTVFIGEKITNFKPISTGTKLYDFINNPEFYELVDIPEVQKFFTFVPIIQADVIWEEELETSTLFDFSLIHSFLQKIKPAYTDYIIGIELKLKEEFQLFLDAAKIEETILLTKTVDINYMNYMILPTYAAVNGIPGATLTDQVDNVKDLIEFSMDEERVGLFEELVINQDVELLLTETVGNGPLVNNSPAEGSNPVNYFSIGPSFETLNGTTNLDYNDHLFAYPQFDLDLEKVGLRESIEVRDLITSAVLAQA